MRHNRQRRRMVWPWIFVLLLCAQLLPAGSAFAGYNELIVATDGDGITVYTSSSGSKKAGILYNGYTSELSLDDTHGRFSCLLTLDYTVWLNLEKAENRMPSRMKDEENSAWMERFPCNIFLAEIAEDYTPVYTSPQHKHITEKHMQGTLCVVYGEFGSDYYLEGPVSGFVARDAVRKIADMNYNQAHSQTYIWDEPETRMLYASEDCPVYPATSASGYSDVVQYRNYTSDREVTVLRDLGDWVQLTGSQFVEKRFLDPEGDHTYPVEYVKTDGVLDRLNVRWRASTDANVDIKLCSGVPVHVISRTEEWAVVYVAGPNGGVKYAGCAMAKYLEPSEDVRSGATQVRLVRDVYGNREMTLFRESGKGDVLPAGTLLSVIGVEPQGSSNANQEDRLLCETEDGRYITILNSGILEPVSDSGIMAAARSALRMRKAPDPKAETICQVKAKTKVEVLLRGEIWSVVKYKGETGYMMSRYLSFP